MSKFDYKKYIKDNKFTISEAPKQRMINERSFMGGIVTNGLALNNPLEKKESVTEEAHTIKVDKESEVTSSRVKKEIESLAKKGVRSKDIKLNLKGVNLTGGPGSKVGDKFQVLKNKVYFAMKNESKQSVNEFIVDKRDIKNNIGSNVKIKMGNKTVNVVLSDLDGNTVHLMTKDGKSGKVTVDRFLSMVESVTSKK